jgi:hypothetical protein
MGYQFKMQREPFNFKSILGRWTARKDTGSCECNEWIFVRHEQSLQCNDASHGVAVQRWTALRWAGNSGMSAETEAEQR